MLSVNIFYLITFPVGTSICVRQSYLWPFMPKKHIVLLKAVDTWRTFWYEFWKVTFFVSTRSITFKIIWYIIILLNCISLTPLTIIYMHTLIFIYIYIYIYLQIDSFFKQWPWGFGIEIKIITMLPISSILRSRDILLSKKLEGDLMVSSIR